MSLAEDATGLILIFFVGGLFYLGWVLSKRKK